MFNIDQSQNPYDLSNQIGNFYKGYQMAFIPQQMKDQQQLQQMQKMYQMQQMQYAPELNQQKLEQIRLQNQGVQSENQLTAYKMQQEKMKQAREDNFLKALYGNNAPSRDDNVSGNEDNEQNNLPNNQLANQNVGSIPVSLQNQVNNTYSGLNVSPNNLS